MYCHRTTWWNALKHLKLLMQNFTLVDVENSCNIL